MDCAQCGAEVSAGIWCGPCEAELAEVTREYFDGICPPIYRDVDGRLIPRPELHERVAAHWRNGSGHPVVYKAPQSWGWDKPGLLLWGSSRSGKTRAAFAALRRLTMQGDQPLFYPATVWAQEVVRRSLNGELDDWLEMLSGNFDHGMLFLDDIDKVKFSPKVTQTFYTILEQRFCRGLGVLLTMNSTADQLAKKIPEE